MAETPAPGLHGVAVKLRRPADPNLGIEAGLSDAHPPHGDALAEAPAAARLLIPTPDKHIDILAAFEAEAEGRENDLCDAADEGKEDDRDNASEQVNESGFEITTPPKGVAKSCEAIAKARHRRVFGNDEAWAFRMEYGGRVIWYRGRRVR